MELCKYIYRKYCPVFHGSFRKDFDASDLCSTPFWPSTAAGSDAMRFQPPAGNSSRSPAAKQKRFWLVVSNFPFEKYGCQMCNLPSFWMIAIQHV